MDCIFALATAPGRAGVAVVRISGAGCRAAVAPLVGVLPQEGRVLRRVRGSEGEVLDIALVLTFPEGRSFTGEETVELHLHGSPAVVAAVLRVLSMRPGLRPAEAGEFTRRAFGNGRLDLAQVEGLADLIDAETEAQRRQALRVFAGGLGEKAARWRASLIRAEALVAAAIDFSDEDIPGDVLRELRGIVEALMAELRSEVEGSRVAERLRDGFEVAVTGAPNAGKSSLVNMIAGRDVAITSARPGTTRDVIEVRLDLRGMPVTLLDTAGLREATDEVERVGIARALARAERADLRIHLVEPGGTVAMTPREDDIVVSSKSDLGAGEGLCVSALTGEGVDALLDAVAGRLSARVAGAGVAVRERHRLALVRALDALSWFEAAGWALDGREEFAAEALRGAGRAIESLVGRVDVEEILGEIFASFCIGK